MEPDINREVMPTYEYQCEKCGKNFDAFQSMRDTAFATCPKEKCQMEEWGEGTVKRLISSGGGLIFKGTGFYITDYRSDNYKKSAKSESGASTGGDAKPAPASSTPPSASPAAPASPAKPAKPTSPASGS